MIELEACQKDTSFILSKARRLNLNNSETLGQTFTSDISSFKAVTSNIINK